MIRDPHFAAVVHALFEYAALVLGVWLYRRQREPAPLLQPGGFALAAGLLAGAGLGNKLVNVAEHPELLSQWAQGQWVMPGQSIVGGLLGGLLGVELAKALIGRRASTGDRMVLPIAAGLMLGRIGCFLAGLHDDTFGRPTTLPWGLDFGDGVPRHPTQLYELLAVGVGTAVLLRWTARRPRVPGLRFKLFLAGYLAWRLAVETLKPLPAWHPLGFSGIQWVCAIALVLYLPVVLRAWRASPGPTAAVAA